MALHRIIALLALIGVCHCQPNCSYWRLWDYLNLTTSNTFMANVRPVEDWRTTTHVSIEMIIYGILDVDAKTQTVDGATWVTVSWLNEFLTWDPDEFCGINVITVPRSWVWLPDLYIQEEVSDTSSIKNSPYVSLDPDGWAVSFYKQHLTFTCELNLSLFPFDDQSCNITFESMSSCASVLTLVTMTNGTQLNNVSKKVLLTQGEWQLKNITIIEELFRKSNNQTFSKLIYNVLLSRKPMLYVINFIFPLFFFLILDLASFFIDEARGEKMSFKITILLSISVLLLILKDLLPSTEKQMPWIANYTVGIFALVGISVLEAMTITFLFSFEEKVNNETQTSKGEKDFQLEKVNSKDPDFLKMALDDLTKARPPPVSETQAGILQQILLEVKAAREELSRPKAPKTRPRFKKLALVIDHGFFLLYFAAVVVFMAYVYDKWLQRYIEIFSD